MANKIYMAAETSITWTDSGGDETLDMGGLAADAVDCGSYHDLGSGSRSEYYEIELFIDGFDTAPVVGETVDLYFTQSNATTAFDGAPSTDPTTSAEGTVTTDQLPNLLYVGSVTVTSTTAATNLQARFIARLTARYVAPVVHNDTADALLSTADSHKVVLTPIPPEVQ